MATISVNIEVLAVTPDELAAAFTEWERRFRETPDLFMSDMERLARSSEDLGRNRGDYLIEILAEQRALDAG